jgi:hypothetical protein
MGSLKFGIKQICLLIVQRGLDIKGGQYGRYETKLV